MHGSLSSSSAYPSGLGSLAHLSVFPPKHRPGGFFYRFWELVTNHTTIASATRSSELASYRGGNCNDVST